MRSSYHFYSQYGNRDDFEGGEGTGFFLFDDACWEAVAVYEYIKTDAQGERRYYTISQSDGSSKGFTKNKILGYAFKHETYGNSGVTP